MTLQVSILFAGQGSTSVFESLSDELSRFLATSPLAEEFLSLCLEALHSETETLEDENRSLLGNNFSSSFSTPRSLASPPSEFVSDPIIQCTSLYVQQILEYIRYATGTFTELPAVQEANGFCSGLIAAAVAATTRLPLDRNFIRFAVEGFRLVFWIGVRVARNGRTQGHLLQDDPPWSLVVAGVEKEEVAEMLANYNSKENPDFPVCVAAALKSRTFSLAGSGHSLQDFRENYLPKNIEARSANVHGYYHGGTSISATTKTEILEDVARRVIGFPNWEHLVLPIRSTSNGTYITQNEHQTSVLETVLDLMLMQPVEWQKLSVSLVTDAEKKLEQDSLSSYQILAIGPNAKSLLPAMRGSRHPRLNVTNMTSASINNFTSDDIAIVGMGVNFPSGDGVSQFWNTIKEGLNVVSEMPASRFNMEEYYDTSSDRASTRKTKSKFGNFIENPFAFDNEFFHISPREAKSMDPQQRILLHTALSALEDAGYAADATPTYQRETFGVYVGVATEDYVHNTRDSIDVYYSTGTLRAFLSGRISYAFDFGGPSVVIDTACSSSTVALYQACRALRNGDCEAALAGGVNVITSPDMHIGLGRAHFLNESGQCKPFDVSADGYCRAEGCGLFVLKRVTDAVAENDHILGVIRGIDVNQCGTSKSITYPDSATQGQLFKRIFNRYTIDPNTISVVEAHGTGTQAGDHAEVNSIRSAFGLDRKANNPLFLSSVKGNIGHAEAASGAAGLAKLLLMMKEQQLPPQAAHKVLNPRLGDLEATKIVIPRELTPWMTPYGAPRRALLNNFGAAGSNAGLIVEEYRPTVIPSVSTERSSYLLNISAKTADALKILCEKYCEVLANPKSELQLENIAYSATARRIEYNDFRVSLQANTMDRLQSQLKSIQIPPKFSKAKENMVVFVFSGQGAVFQGMGAELLRTAPVFREAVRTCDAILKNLGYPETEPCMHQDGNALSDPTSVENTVVAQCACFVLEYALAKLWMSFGILPDIAVGHSLGEYAMLAISSVMTLRDSLYLVAKRADLMKHLCKTKASGMTACGASASKIEALIAGNTERYPDLSIACKNSFEDCVVGGSLSSLANFEQDVKAMGLKAKRLDVPYGFHSSAMDPILDEYHKVTSSIAVHEPRFLVASSTLGKIVHKDDMCPDNFVRHAREAVDFAAALTVVKELSSDKKLLFLEVGPAPRTLPMVKATLKEDAGVMIPSLRPSEESWVSINAALSCLFSQRQPVKWTEVFRGSKARLLNGLPRYPLNSKTFVIPYSEPQHATVSEVPSEPAAITSPYTFLKGSRKLQEDGTVAFNTAIGSLSEYIKSHSVGGAPLCPASVYMELAAEASDLYDQSRNGPSFSLFKNISFDKPLVYSEMRQIEVLASIDEISHTFKVTSGTGDVHCTGQLTDGSVASIQKDFQRAASVIARQVGSMTPGDVFSSRIIYDVIFPRVVAYSGPFLAIKQLTIAASGLEGFGRFQLPASGHEGFTTPPAFIDTLLHAAGFIANSKVSAEEACICTEVEEAVVPRGHSLPLHEEMTVYCSLIDGVKGYVIADAYALDSSKNVRAAVRGMHFKILRLKSFQAHLAHVIHAAQTTTTASPRLVKAQNIRKAAPVVEKRSLATSAGHAVALKVETNADDDLTTLKSILSDLCGTDSSVNEQTSLEALGVDSLLFIEMAQKLEQRFPELRGVKTALECCSTIVDIHKLIQSVTADGSDSDVTSPTFSSERSSGESSLRTSGSQTPVTLKTPSEPNIDDLAVFMKTVVGVSTDGLEKTCTLESLGVDSLLSIEVEQGLQETFGISIGATDTLPGLTIADLEKLILDTGSKASEVLAPKHRPVLTKTRKRVPTSKEDHIEESLSVPKSSTADESVNEDVARLFHTPGDAQTSLYLFHDGSGTSSVYSKLSPLPCKLYGVSSVDFQSINPNIRTLEQLATECIKQARLMDVENLILGGWSFGGVLAFEISRQLQARGRAVHGVILIDSPSPINHEPLPDRVIDKITTRMPARTRAAQMIQTRIQAQFKRNAKLLGAYRPVPDHTNAPCYVLQCDKVVDTVALCGISYPWLADAKFREEGLKDWQSLTGKPVVPFRVKGDHFDLFQPQNVEDVLDKLRKAVLAILD